MSCYTERTEARLKKIRETREALILAVETSCDETSAAIVQNGRIVKSNVVYSQIPIHEKYGGVVPELASRNHVDQLPGTTQAALKEASLTLNDIDAVAVTAYPGLTGALLTGLSYAKGLAYSLSLPLIGVDHILGHIAANYISHKELVPPFVALVASGGHSHLFYVKDYNDIETLGRTRDDAAGEAFDKIARALGLGYPGGPKLEQLAKSGDAATIPLPAGLKDGSLDFSFSGLKTAVINAMHKAEQKGEALNKADVAASFQNAVITALTKNSIRAAQEARVNTLVLAGGVSANTALNNALDYAANEAGLLFLAPERGYTGDNAAMIGSAGYYALLGGEVSGLELNARARR